MLPTRFFSKPTYGRFLKSIARPASIHHTSASLVSSQTTTATTKNVNSLTTPQRRALHQSTPYAASPAASDKMPNQGKGNPAYTRDSLFDLTGKVALITGGGSGIGLMCTQALAANGCKVYISGRTLDKLTAVVDKYSSDIPGSIHPLQADVSTKAGVKKLHDDYAAKESVCDILVNNAGVSSASLTTESDGDAHEMKANTFETDKTSNEDWNDTYNTNVTATYFVATAFLPLLQASSDKHPKWSSTILFISSISGLIKTAQHHFSYNASKAAAVHLTRMLSHELTSSQLKIRVNGIAPGVFPSEMTTDGSDENQKSHIPAEKYREKVPAGRPGRDEDMAGAVLFAVTNQYLQGQTFAVDGGYTVAAGM